jgi:hypothetical protein
MKKAIMGTQKCHTYMIEVLNNYKFNESLQNRKLTYEQVNEFIPLIIPLGYRFYKMTRQEGHFTFLIIGSNCKQISVGFQGDFDHIEHFN